MPKSKKSPGWGGKRTGAGPKVRSLRLSVNEAMLIVDAFNGSMIDGMIDGTDPIQAESIIWQEIDDAIRLDYLDTKWHVDGPVLVERLKKLDHDTAIDLLKSVRQFWSANYVANSEQRVKDVGLASK